MMKKVIFLLSLGVFTFIFLETFVLPRNVYANCEERNILGSCDVFPGLHRFGWYYCTDPSGKPWCCTQIDECKTLPTSVSMAPYLCGAGDNQGVNTSLGCIPTNPAQFTTWLLRFAIGIGGGIAFLLMLWGGLQIVISAGNPEKIKAGREIMTSALAGLILIIFSVFLLRLIGYDILRLPGFGR